jgi:hypothetical protein
MIAYVIFQILPVVLLLAYTLYLAYVRVNLPRRKMLIENVTRKYKGTPYLGMRIRMYSTRFLAASTLVTLSFIEGLIAESYRHAHPHPSNMALAVTSLADFVSLMALLLGLFLAAKSPAKRESGHTKTRHAKGSDWSNLP